MRENRFYVYAFLNASEDCQFEFEGKVYNHKPFYIGKGTGSRRYDHFIPSVLSRSTPFYRKLRKLLRGDAFNDTEHVVVLKDNMSEKDAFNLEAELISTLGRITLTKENGILYNVADGGYGGNTLTDANRSQCIARHKAAMAALLLNGGAAYRKACADGKHKYWSGDRSEHTKSIKAEMNRRICATISKKLNTEVSLVRWNTPFGVFDTLSDVASYLGTTKSYTRDLFFKKNDTLISKTSVFRKNGVEVTRSNVAWKKYKFLHPYEGQTFYDAGFAIEVTSDGTAVLTAGRSLS